jgi:hypothetical protein
MPLDEEGKIVIRRIYRALARAVISAAFRRMAERYNLIRARLARSTIKYEIACKCPGASMGDKTFVISVRGKDVPAGDSSAGFRATGPP